MQPTNTQRSSIQVKRRFQKYFKNLINKKILKKKMNKKMKSHNIKKKNKKKKIRKKRLKKETRAKKHVYKFYTTFIKFFILM